METPWDFIEKYYVGYSSSNDIMRANDLDMILTEPEIEWTDHAVKIWEYEARESISEVVKLQDEIMVKIYNKAIQGYIDELNKK